MMADMRARLTEKEFDQIARINPVKYLERCKPGAAADSKIVEPETEADQPDDEEEDE